MNAENTTIKMVGLNRTEASERPTTKERVLEYLQDNPIMARHTNAEALSRQLVGKYPEYTRMSYATAVRQLCKQGALIWVGSSRRRTYSINYLHKAVPEYIRARASKEDKKHIQEMLAKVSPETSITEDGVLVTKTPQELAGDEAEDDTGAADEPVQATSEAQTPVVTKICTSDGRNISIALTINLNGV